jgi:hypothetical protein
MITSAVAYVPASISLEALSSIVSDDYPGPVLPKMHLLKILCLAVGTNSGLGQGNLL